MKKGLKFVLALTTLLAVPATLVSCGETPVSSSQVDENQEIVNSALAALTVPSETTEDINLVTVGLGGTTITWASDNAAITINGNKGVVTRPTDVDATVKLTATGTKGSATGTREFTVTVKKIDLSNYEIVTVAEAKAAADGATLYLRGIVGQMVPYSSGSGIYNSSCYIVDATGALYLFNATNFCEEVSEGDEVVISGTKATYYDAPQLTYPNLELNLSKNNEIPLDSVIEGETVTTVLAKTDKIAGNIYKLTGTISKGSGTGDTGSYVYYRLTDAAGKYINVYWNSSKAGSYTEIPAFSWLDAYDGQNVTCAFVINSSNSSGTWRGHVLHIYE